MFCSRCGSNVNNASFCPNCGTPLGNNAASNMGLSNNNGYTYNNGISKMTNPNIVTLVSCVLRFIAIFMPLGSYRGEIITLDEGSLAFLIMTIVGLIVGFIGKNIPIIVVGVILCMQMCNMISYASEVMLEPQIGYFLIIFSTTGVILSPFINKFIQRK